MQFDVVAGNENSSLLFEISPNHKSVINRYDIFYIIVISLFAHIGYNPIEQQNILTIHVYNYIKNIGETKKVHNNSTTGKKKVVELHYILYIME